MKLHSDAQTHRRTARLQFPCDIFHQLLFIATMFLFLGSCQKEILLETESISSKEIGTRSIFTSSFEQTTLGAKRQNPYSLANVQIAYDSIYNTSQQLLATHKYIKISPATEAHVAALDSIDLNWQDFDLLYEIQAYGRYYQPPVQGSFSDLYSVVDLSFSTTKFPYTVIESLYLDESDPFLLAESFRLTGNSAEITDAVFKGGLSISQLAFYDGTTIEALIIEPPCPEGCFAVLIEGGVNVHPKDWVWECDCSNQPNETTLEINDCGCSVYKNDRKPGGCINVEDTQLGMRGVEDVRVSVWNGWFSFYNTQSDLNGCWRISNEVSGKNYVKIEFRNQKSKIRGVASNWYAGWEWIVTVVDHLGQFSGGDYNDIEVNYFQSGDNGSQAHQYWAAATINNGIQEFHRFASADGINAPRNGLDVLMSRNRTDGYALMDSQYLLAALVNNFSQLGFFFGPFVGIITVSTAPAATMLYLPEVMIGTNFQDSDRFKSLIFHEIAHVSHYSQVGLNYWNLLVAAEVFANGWGDGDEPDAGRVQVCESWAEHIGDSYTDRVYGLNHSNVGPLNTTLQIAEGRWINRLEGRFKVFGHVPVALYHDLIDNNASAIFGSVESIDVLNDGNLTNQGVRGYTNQFMFSKLDASVNDPIEFREAIKTNLPFGVTNNDVDNLFLDYEFE